MQEIKQNEQNEELIKLCSSTRQLIKSANYDSCYKKICNAMRNFPSSPHPHNLLGILFEMEGKHDSAMRHFRAACDLEPTYLPAKQNLEVFGTFYSSGKCAFDETDCIVNRKTGKIEINNNMF